MDYQEVVRETARLFVSQEAAVGFGNDMWSASWLSQVFMLAASTESHLFKDALTLLLRVFLFSQFSADRIKSSIKKLLSDLAEVKRDGGSVLSAVMTRITTSPASRGAKVLDHKAAVSNSDANDLQISVFRQEPFLKSLLKRAKESEAGAAEITDALDELRNELVLKSGSHPGFLELAVPESTTLNKERSLEVFLQCWKEEVARFKTADSSYGDFNRSEIIGPFPFPRQIYSSSIADRSFSNGLLVPVEGVCASSLAVVVPCDVMGTKEQFAVSLLCELLSRTEGPLYTSIRGKGLAYGASVYQSIWSGQLVFDVSESSDPRQALDEFFGILDLLKTEDGFLAEASPFFVDTARAALAYRLVTARGSAGSCIISGLKACLRGFTTIENEKDFERLLYQVTVEDLKTVFQKYFFAVFR